MRKLVLSLLTIALLACGGGGGSDSSSSIAGRWAGDLFLVSNSCGFQVSDNEGVAFRVNVDGTRVVLDAVRASGEPVTMTGSTIENGARVSRNQTVGCTGGRGSQAQIVETYEVFNNGEVTYTVNNGQCSGGNSVPACEYVRKGTFTRTGD